MTDAANGERSLTYKRLRTGISMFLIDNLPRKNEMGSCPPAAEAER